MTPFLSNFLPEAENDFVFSVVGSPWSILVGYLLLINLITFFTFGLDKWKAKRTQSHPATRRIPEKSLFLLSLLGGSPGALVGMRIFHHKTLHKTFTIGIPLILLMQIVIAAGLFVYFHALAA